MTIAFSFLVIMRIFVLCGLFAPLAMLSGGDKAGRRKRTIKKGRGRKPKRRTRVVKKRSGEMDLYKPVNPKAAARPLSEFETRTLNDYFVRRDFVLR